MDFGFAGGDGGECAEGEHCWEVGGDLEVVGDFVDHVVNPCGEGVGGEGGEFGGVAVEGDEGRPFVGRFGWLV